MASNPPKGDGHRNGEVRKRSHVFNPRTGQWVKRAMPHVSARSAATPACGFRSKPRTNTVRPRSSVTVML